MGRNMHFHTAIANLVLLPRPFAGLTDHHGDIQAALKFRSFELYQWSPDPEQPPPRPERYPDDWRTPFPMTERVQRFLGRRRTAAGPL